MRDICVFSFFPYRYHSLFCYFLVPHQTCLLQHTLSLLQHVLPARRGDLSQTFQPQAHTAEICRIAAARPGARLEIHARVAGRIGRLVKIDGEVTADGVVVAAGALTLAG